MSTQTKNTSAPTMVDSQAGQEIFPFGSADSWDVFLENNSNALAKKNAVASIVEVQKQNVLTKSEANALVEFVMSKFVERRFDDYMKTVFRHRTLKGYWMLHGFEAVNHERRA